MFDSIKAGDVAIGRHGSDGLDVSGGECGCENKMKRRVG